MRRVPIILVILAVAFNLWTLRAERIPVAQVNDGAMHTQMIRWAADRIDDGHVPLDGWYPNLALGSAQFHHYPSLPHVLMAPLALEVEAEALYPLSVYLLLSLWPLAVYFGARGFGWDPLAAACSALVAPLIASVPGYGFEYDSYT